MNSIDGDGLFSARVLELARRAERGEVAVSEFFTPREIRASSSVLERGGYRGTFAFFGGYENAERARLICLPDYMLYGGEEEIRRTAADAAAGEVSVLYVRGSGYRTLSHRDFMGAILSLGIKRHVVGDIIADEDGHGAYVFCDAKIGGYIAENLAKVASDTVKVSIVTLPDGFSVRRRTEPISDTVASMRADCVISALVRCSRERAKELIVSGMAEVNYEAVIKPDAVLEVGDIVSVRGAGKFVISGIDGVTRRGRMRLTAERYI